MFHTSESFFQLLENAQRPFVLLDEQGHILKTSSALRHTSDGRLAIAKRCRCFPEGLQQIDLKETRDFLPREEGVPVSVPVEAYFAKESIGDFTVKLKVYAFMFRGAASGKSLFLLYLAWSADGRMELDMRNNKLTASEEILKLRDLLVFVNRPDFVGSLVTLENTDLPNEKILAISPELATLLHYQADELPGQALGAILPDTPAQLTREVVDKVFEKHRTLLSGKNGYVLLDCITINIKSDEGHTGQIVRFFSHLCREEAEENSLAGNELHTQFLSDEDSVCYTTDPRGIINWASRSFVAYSGYELSELLNQTPLFFTCPETDTKEVEKMLGYFSSGSAESYVMEIVTCNKQGQQRLETQNISRTLDSEGRLTGYIIEIDTPQNKTIGKKRLVALAKVAEASEDCIVVTNRQGRIEWVNPAFTESTGYSLEEVSGKTPGEILQGPETRKEDVKAIGDKLAQNEPFNHKITNYTKAGERYEVLLNISPVKDVHGKVTNFVAIQHFLTGPHAERRHTKVDRHLLEAMEMVARQYEELEASKADLEMKNKNLNIAYETLRTLNRSYYGSINAASKLQEALMPNQYYVERKLEKAFILYKPKDIVGGDFFWFHENGDEQRVVIGDCTGHGVQGAFMTVMAINLMEQYLKDCPETELLENITRMDEHLRSRFLGNIFSSKQSVDGFEFGLLNINKKTGYVSFCGSRLKLLKIDRKGLITEYDSDRMPVGGNYRFYPEKHFQTLHRFSVERGDRYFISSDGFADQFSSYTKKKFSWRQYKDLLATTSLLDIEQQRQKLYESFYKWKGKERQIDDIVIFGWEV